MRDDRHRPSIREALENWRFSDAGFFTKLRLTAKNEWKKVRTLKGCCGNIDEPGC